MASAQREYEMLFKLSAQLGTSFNGTFSSAQKVLSATQSKIQELNKAQSNIAAYQKQQSGIEATNQKLEMYRKQLTNTNTALDTVRKEIEANGKASGELAAKESDLANKQLQLQNRIRNTEQTIADKNQRLAALAQRLEEAGVDTNKLDTEVLRLGMDLAHLRSEEEKAGEEAEKFGGSGQTAFEAVGAALAAAGITTALKEIYEAFTDCVNVASEFEATMSTVEALSGANASEMNELSEAAKYYGATTVFTAKQSADAMTYMGMAGWDASEMLSGMNGVMSLAAASGEDLALVSDIVTDNLTAFGLSASDTAHFADVLAMAATKSNTSVGIMGETFSNSAAIAGALGYSIEDVSTAVGLMANSGVKGSVAGTALKNVFNGLLEGATLTGEAIGDVEFTSVNADGTMKSFSETIDELRVHFDQMTEAERVNNAIAIAGKYGYNGLLAILNSTQEEYDSLHSSISNASGAAERMAEIQLDNLKGDVTLLDSATEGLKMTVGSLYNEELRQLTQIGTEIIDGIHTFIEERPAVTKAIMAIAAMIGTATFAYTALNAVKKAQNALDVLGTALKIKKTAATGAEAVAQGANALATTGAAAAHKTLNLAMLANPAVIITGAIIALTAGIVAMREACNNAAIEEWSLSTATDEQKSKVDSLNSEYEEACKVYGETSDEARALKYDLDEATAAVESQSFSVGELYNEIDELHDTTDSLLTTINDATGGICAEQEQAHILAAKMKEISNSSDTAAHKQEQLAPIVERLNTLYPSLGLTVGNVSEKMNGLSEAIDRASETESLQAKYEAANESLADLYTQQAKLQEAYDKAGVTWQKAAKVYTSVVTDNWVTNVGSLIDGTAQKAEEELDEAAEKQKTALDDLKKVNAAIAECEAAIFEYTGAVLGSSEKTIAAYDAMSIATADVKEQVESLVAAYNDAYSAAYSSVSGQYAIWDTAASVVPTSISAINNSISSQIKYWDSYNTNLEALSKRAKEIEGLADIIAGFADGGQESVNAIAGMSKASDEELRKMVESYSMLKQEQSKTSEALADIKTDFENQMDDITQTMSATVEKMNLDDEARTAAIATIDAYANAITARKTFAVEAAEAVAAATNAVLLSASEHETEATLLKRTYTGETDYSRYGHAYARGTDHAQRGVALVGEEGPELVFMNGGEKVVNAEITREMLSGSSAITISPQFVINNNGGSVDDSQVSEMSDTLVRMVLDALDSAGVDRRRSVYA